MGEAGVVKGLVRTHHPLGRQLPGSGSGLHPRLRAPGSRPLCANCVVSPLLPLIKISKGIKHCKLSQKQKAMRGAANAEGEEQSTRSCGNPGKGRGGVPPGLCPRAAVPKSARPGGGQRLQCLSPVSPLPHLSPTLWQDVGCRDCLEGQACGALLSPGCRVYGLQTCHPQQPSSSETAIILRLLDKWMVNHQPWERPHDPRPCPGSFPESWAPQSHKHPGAGVWSHGQFWDAS